MTQEALRKRVEEFLTLRDELMGRMKKCNENLLQLFNEVHYWERLHFEIPYVAMDIAAHRERYRCLREIVLS